MQKSYFYLKTFDLKIDDGREHNVVNIGLFSSREKAIEHVIALGKSLESEGYEFAIIELSLIA
ncbi:hypothetical protein [Acinetobacter bereziniae]|jgi:hypothetical protein|uniref:hypothetical protein n=1 Tax=Acinetobacter bereziniae TaxID=106648 RepID=UPI00125EF13E|nr:hypothetical protein [Acinetobacter bereziniae]MCU4434736.1 hypothetical protein [Acinetobacter bereziniae]MCV2445637.1 hypothetical protein [Acinetobacter bereziniae]MDV8154536.1 hypothetical protein [Acinetobacter bereziniae]